tara:strand:- start:84 stop:206 length:123 start_codon:yes stop_codon:yes gene_type:complete
VEEKDVLVKDNKKNNKKNKNVDAEVVDVLVENNVNKFINV